MATFPLGPSTPPCQPTGKTCKKQKNRKARRPISQCCAHTPLTTHPTCYIHPHFEMAPSRCHAVCTPLHCHAIQSLQTHTRTHTRRCALPYAHTRTHTHYHLLNSNWSNTITHMHTHTTRQWRTQDGVTLGWIDVDILLESGVPLFGPFSGPLGDCPLVERRVEARPLPLDQVVGEGCVPA